MDWKSPPLLTVIVAAIVPALWVIGFLLLIVTDAATDNGASTAFGGIFLFIGAIFLSIVMVPLCIFLGIRLLRRGSLRQGVAVLALQVVAVGFAIYAARL